MAGAGWGEAIFPTLPKQEAVCLVLGPPVQEGCWEHREGYQDRQGAGHKTHKERLEESQLVSSGKEHAAG